jgi:DNA-binding NtrC family response regulator
VMPPLRDRKEDIPLLAQHFLERFQALAAQDAKNGDSRPGDSRSAPDARSGAVQPFRQPMTISQEAMRRLMSYHWPGNVRQLENAIERAVAFSGGRSQIDVADLPPELLQVDATPVTSVVSLPEEGLDLEEVIAAIERDLIERSLERTGGNKGHAARLLNLKRTTLVEKLKRLQR